MKIQIPISLSVYQLVRGLVLLHVAGIAQAGSPENWTVRAPLPTSSHILGVNHFNGQFLAAGGYGGLLASRDGSNWIVRDLGDAQKPDSYLEHIGYGNGQYVAVGLRGFIATSIDGVEWTERESSVVTGLASMAYGNGRFVVVGGERGTRAILTSENGIRWIVRELSGKGKLWQVVFAQDTFVAVGNNGGILTSRNGIDWKESIPSRADRLSGVAFGNGRFVVVGDYESFTSIDGFTWTKIDSPRGGPFSPMKGPFLTVAFGNGQFVVLGDGDYAWRSSDGLAWTVSGTGVISYPLAITFGDGKFVAVGLDGFVASSSDGANWVSHSHGRNILFDKVAGGGGLLLATGLSSVQTGANAYQMTTPLVSSLDGSTWSDLEFAANYHPISVDYVGGQFVVFARDNRNPSPVFVLTSSDGRNWDRTDLNWNGGASRVIYADGKYLGVGGGIFHSPDGRSWTVQPAPTNNGLLGVAYGNGRYIAIESTGTAYISADGITWTARANSGLGFTDIVFAKGQFVAPVYTRISGPGWESFFYLGQIATSPDGETWNLNDSPSSLEHVELNSLAYGGGWFVAVGARGTILISSDGTRWTAARSGTAEPLASVAYAEGRFVAVGARGTTVVSENVLAARLQHASNSIAGFSFTVSGQPGNTYRLQSTTDLASPWEEIGTITLDAESEVFFAPGGAVAPSQFYRVVNTVK